MRKILPILIITAILILGSYLFFKQSSFLQTTPKYTGPVEKLTLGISKGAPELSSLIYIAESKGYFSNQGLQVTTTIEESGITAQKNVAAGTIELGTTSDFGFVSDSFTLPNLRILAIINKAFIIDIIARKDTGITKPSDLKGKRIGIVPKTALEFYLGRFLTLNNLLLADVTIVPLTFPTMQAAIVGGEVDAVATNDPFSYQIKVALGENSVFWNAQQGTANNWLLITNEETIASKSQPIGRFIQAMIQAEEFVKVNPTESKQIVIDRLKSDQKYFDHNWPKNTFIVTLDQALLLSMEDKARWRIANKLTDKTLVPNYTDFIYTDALRKVKLDAVTLY